MSKSEEKKSTKKVSKEEKSTKKAIKEEKTTKKASKEEKSTKKAIKEEKTTKKDSKNKDSEKKKKKENKSKKDSNSASASTSAKSLSVFSATPAAFDSTISSLFANSLGPSKPETSAPAADNHDSDNDDDDDELTLVNDDDDVDDEQEEDDEELSEIDEEIEDESDEEVGARAVAAVLTDGPNDRKRKRKDNQDNLEDVYMDRLARDEEKAAAKQKEERALKRQKKAQEDGADSAHPLADSDAAANSDSEDEATPPPMHESLMPDTTSDLAKSQRTVFLGNVSSDAITSKSAEKTLRNHLSSFFPSLDAPAKDQPKHAIESIRFRSTAFASAIPKKAAFAKKELMEATTKSTNAYVVYSSSQLSREAARRLNGTVVLDRHLRVDEVAHPAKVDHKRCIFVGNLGFVDDESNIDKANEEEGLQKRKGKKIPSDVEEGLWRTFATCGKVESVRVVRDPKTRVGKGFAYVQFDDENAVEAALLLNEKRFPPMLPRKLRVVRAKAIKRNAKPSQANSAPTQTRSARAGGVYNPKMTSQEQSNLGRAGKLFGRAAAAQLHRGGPDAPADAIKGPEKFIFEGHRASNKNGKTGLKFGKKGKPGSKTSKSSKSRAAAWKGKNK